MRVAHVLVALALLVSGCAPATPVASPSPSAEPPIVRVTFDMKPLGLAQVEMVTDGVRTRIRYPSEKPGGRDEPAPFSVSDGLTQVMCDPTGCRRDAAEPTPLPGTPAFERQCPKGEQTGTGELLGRRTTLWRCAGEGTQATELTLDAEFPSIQLKRTSRSGQDWAATAFEAGITVPADYFSLDGPGMEFVPAKPRRVTPPKPGTRGAVLPRFSGGELQMTDYTAGPAAIVIGEESQLRAALARMRRVTGGRLPTVVGVLQLHVPADEAPEMAPFEVPVALNSDEGNAWEKGVSDGQRWPVSLFCAAAGKGCTAVAVWDLSDAELAAELAKLVTQASASGIRANRVVYEFVWAVPEPAEGGGPITPGRMEYLWDGVRSRTNLPGRDDHPVLHQVWDGEALLTNEGGKLKREIGVRPRQPAKPAPGEPPAGCSDAQPTGPQRFLDRPVSTWHCAGSGMQSTTIWVDDELQMMVKSETETGEMWTRAISIETGVIVPADTFSTEVPGQRAPQPRTVRPPKQGKPGAEPSAVTGGKLRLSDYTKGPGIVLVGDEDQVRLALERLLPFTDGRRPPIAGVINLAGPPYEIPKDPFAVPVAWMDDGAAGDAWRKLLLETPQTVIFCAAGARCWALPLPMLTDASIKAELAKLR